MPDVTSLVSARPGSALSSPFRLFVAWQNPQTRSIAPVGVLERRTDGYSFAYLRRSLDVPGFRPFLGFDDLDTRYESPELFPLFRQRLMDEKRPDYRTYLTVLGLDEGAPPLTILGRSEGHRAGDSIFLVREPEVAEDGKTQSIFFVHGARYQEGAPARISGLTVGETLLLRDDLSNLANPKAILVSALDEQPLGYVPDVLVGYVHRAREVDQPTITVQQVNGEDVPPNLRLLVRLEARLPAGYRPFMGPEWQTQA
jgi:hypothetical protein